jgi:hypothetical protein
MDHRTTNLPNTDEIARLLKAHRVANATVKSDQVTVVMNPELQLVSVDLCGPAVLPEHRTALQKEIVDTVNRAMREIVTSSARAFEGMEQSPELRSMYEAFQKEIDRKMR